MAKVKVQVLDENQGIVMLTNVRLGFKCLWKENIYEGRPTGRQVAQFLFEDDEVQQYDVLKGLALKIVQGVDKNIKSVSEIENERFAEYNGSSGEHNWVFRTSNSEKYPALYVGLDGLPDRTTPPEEIEDKVIYAGCRVNAKVQMSARPSKRKRDKVCLWPNLVAIQFAGDDRRIGGASDEQIASGFEKKVQASSSETEGFGPSKGVNVDDMFN